MCAAIHPSTPPHPGTGKYERLVARCRDLEPITTAVAHPREATALAGALEAGEAGLSQPILVGPAAQIPGGAPKAGADLGGTPIVDVARDGFDRRNRGQLTKDVRSADIAGVDDERHAGQRVSQLRAEQAVRVGDETDDERRH